MQPVPGAEDKTGREKAARDRDGMSVMIEWAAPLAARVEAPGGWYTDDEGEG